MNFRHTFAFGPSPDLSPTVENGDYYAVRFFIDNVEQPNIITITATDNLAFHIDAPLKARVDLMLFAVEAEGNIISLPVMYKWEVNGKRFLRRPGARVEELTMVDVSPVAPVKTVPLTIGGRPLP